MKNHFVIALLFIAQIGWAQSYIPLPDSNAKWINVHSTFTGDPYIPKWQVQFCASGEDTTINATSYFKIDTCAGGYKGAMRNDTGRVFYVPKDSTKEFLLYDFTVEEGDTLFDVYIENPGGYGQLHDFKVDSGAVDSGVIDGVYRKKIRLGPPLFKTNQIDRQGAINGAYGTSWFEGIGNVKGLFWEPWDNISGYGLNLHCMGVNGRTVFPVASTAPCESDIGLIDEQKTSREISIFPNPTNKSVTLRTNGPIAQLAVYDPQGRLVFSALDLSDKAVIPAESFRGGVYLVFVRTDAQVFTRKLIRK